MEVDRWTADITATRFRNVREEAARLFDSSARTYLEAEIEVQKEEAVRTSILTEVKAAGAFWKQMVIALATAILVPIIVGGMIAAALTYDKVALTGTDVASRLQITGPSK